MILMKLSIGNFELVKNIVSILDLFTPQMQRRFVEFSNFEFLLDYIKKKK